MPLALILSSHVAGSRVGGGAQALALAQFKIDPVHVPTTLFGRHPGWGEPGGAAVEAETFYGMLDGIEANGLLALTDIVITGYFASPGQVKAAAKAIETMRAGARSGAFAQKPTVIVDPTLGDAGKGLYVPAEVAAAVINLLIPQADIVAPNAWELSRLTGMGINSPETALAAARKLAMPILVSSVRRGGEIGAVYADRHQAFAALHPALPQVPSGTGDLLTALFAAARLECGTAEKALVQAVGGVAELVNSAQAWASPELPIVAVGQKLAKPTAAVRLERLS